MIKATFTSKDGTVTETTFRSMHEATAYAEQHYDQLSGFTAQTVGREQPDGDDT